MDVTASQKIARTQVDAATAAEAAAVAHDSDENQVASAGLTTERTTTAHLCLVHPGAADGKRMPRYSTALPWATTTVAQMPWTQALAHEAHLSYPE